MITTTAAELEGETASRFLFLTIDESAKMTEPFTANSGKPTRWKACEPQEDRHPYEEAPHGTKAFKDRACGKSLHQISFVPIGQHQNPQRPQKNICA